MVAVHEAGVAAGIEDAVVARELHRARDQGMGLEDARRPVPALHAGRRDAALGDEEREDRDGGAIRAPAA
ncbi:MAG: hypothetical protein U0166_01695 [Acidobacteriota bacterium]